MPLSQYLFRYIHTGQQVTIHTNITSNEKAYPFNVCSKR